MESLAELYRSSPIPWHPALIHFPIALLTMALIFDLLYLLTRRTSFEGAGFWSLVTGTAFGLAAVLSGLVARDALEQHTDRGHAIMGTHQTIGLVLLGVFGVLTIWRLAARGDLPQRPRFLFVLLSLGGVGLLGYQGYLGGEMVYEETLGVNYETMKTLVMKTEEGGGHAHDSSGGDEKGAHAHPSAQDGTSGHADGSSMSGEMEGGSPPADAKEGQETSGLDQAAQPSPAVQAEKASSGKAAEPSPTRAPKRTKPTPKEESPDHKHEDTPR